MSVCEPVSRDDLLQNFLLMPAGYVDSLRTVIVGPDYAVRTHDTATSTNLLGAYDEAAGVTAAWPNLGASEVVDQASAVVLIVDALVAYFQDAAAPPGATEGVQNGSQPNEITHNGGATIWAGSGRTVNVVTDVLVGDYIFLDDGGGNTLETTVKSVKFTGSNANILELNDNLPATLTGGTNFNVTVAEIVPQLTLPATDVTLSTTQVQADPGITATTDRVVAATAVIGGTNLSQVYTDYRALRTAGSLTTSVTAVDSLADLDAHFQGWSDPDSVLGFAVARALAPAQTPALDNPPDVLFVAVAADTSDGWTAAINLIKRRRDWYTVAPLTDNATYQGLFVTLMTTRTSLSLDSRVFLSIDLTTETTLVSGAGNTVLVDQSLTAGEDRTVTRDGGIASPFAGTVAGDIVQIAGTDYIIESRISDQTVTITTPATAGAGQVLNNVRHPLTIAEQATDFETRVAAYNSRTVSVVFPPEPTWNGTVVEGYLLAAAAAGLRGYTMPHQSLRSVLMESGWGVPQSGFEFLGELESIAAAGAFVFEVCDQLASPNALVLAPNTTDQSQTIDAREGLVANTDAVTRYVNAQYDCLIGEAKVTFGLFAELRTIANDALELLRNNTTIAAFGSTLISFSVGQPVRDVNLADKVTIPITATISAVLSGVDIDISVSIATPDTVTTA